MGAGLARTPSPVSRMLTTPEPDMESLMSPLHHQPHLASRNVTSFENEQPSNITRSLEPTSARITNTSHHATTKPGTSNNILNRCATSLLSTSSTEDHLSTYSPPDSAPLTSVGQHPAVVNNHHFVDVCSQQSPVAMPNTSHQSSSCFNKAFDSSTVSCKQSMLSNTNLCTLEHPNVALAALGPAPTAIDPAFTAQGSTHITLGSAPITLDPAHTLQGSTIETLSPAPIIIDPAHTLQGSTIETLSLAPMTICSAPITISPAHTLQGYASETLSPDPITLGSAPMTHVSAPTASETGAK